MTFKTAAQIFGDGGAHGAAVPYDTSNPAGTASANRGIQFGEMLTAAVANRTHYALALNTDDLNSRLAPFEVDGLDAAYRNGLLAIAGGGRVITLDGGPVETRSEYLTPVGTDSAAHFLADSTGDSASGGGGFDFKGNGHSPGVARFGLMDRRAVVFSTANTAITNPNAATLNPGGTGALSVRLDAGNFANAGVTDVIPYMDMLEVISGAFAGIYLIIEISTDTKVRVAYLGGSAPTFTADTAVSIRIFRPSFMTASTRSVAGTTFQRGISIAGLPTDDTTDAALSIVPGGRYGVDGTGNDGTCFALRVLPIGANGAALGSLFTVDSLGGLRSKTSSYYTSASRFAHGVELGSPGYYYAASEAAATYEAGFFAYNNIATMESFYGGVILENYAGTYSFEFASDGLSIVVPDTSTPLYRGGVVEIVTPSPQVGFYLIAGATADTGVWKYLLRKLDRTAVVLPTVGSGTLRPLSGVTLGARSITMENPLAYLKTDNTQGTLGTAIRAGASFMAPYSATEDACAMVLVTQRGSTGTPALMRCYTADPINSTNAGAITEVFAVTARGELSCKALRSGHTSVDDLSFNTALAVTDAPIPIHKWSWDTTTANKWDRIRDDVFASHYVKLTGVTVTSSTLFIPISGEIPIGAIVTSLKLDYFWTNSAAGSIFFVLVSVNSQGIETVLEGASLSHPGTETTTSLPLSPSQTEDRTKNLVALVLPGVSSAGDLTVFGCTVTYTLPGVEA